MIEKYIVLKKKLFLKLADLLTPNPTKFNFGSWEKKLFFLRKMGLKIDKGVVIREGFFTYIGSESFISIGKYSKIGVSTKIYAKNKVSIGSFCMFAQDIILQNDGYNENTYEPYSSKLYIGNGVWLGAGVKIITNKNNLIIGNNAIIGAGSIVVDDVPENAIMVGNPAKIVGYRILPLKIWFSNNRYYCPIKFEIVENNKGK